MKLPSFHYQQFHKTYKRFHNVVEVKSKKKASYFILSFTFVSLSFFGIFAIKPTLTTATSLIKSVSDLQKLNIEYENKIASLIRAQSEYEKIRNDLVFVEKALPGSSDFHHLAQTLEKFAQRENITILQLQIENAPISTPASQNKINKLGFSFIGSGNYPSIVSFLNHITNWLRVNNINSLDLSNESSYTSGTPSGIIRMTVKANTFYEP